MSRFVGNRIARIPRVVANMVQKVWSHVRSGVRVIDGVLTWATSTVLLVVLAASVVVAGEIFELPPHLVAAASTFLLAAFTVTAAAALSPAAVELVHALRDERLVRQLYLNLDETTSAQPTPLSEDETRKIVEDTVSVVLREETKSAQPIPLNGAETRKVVEDAFSAVLTGMLGQALGDVGDARSDVRRLKEEVGALERRLNDLEARQTATTHVEEEIERD